MDESTARPRRRRRHHREYGKTAKPFDPDEKRYHVYRLYDAAGQLLYIGRSFDPLMRLRTHHANTEWASKVVAMDGHGPYTWDEVVRREREEILTKRPAHNIDGVLKNTGRTFARVVA